MTGQDEQGSHGTDDQENIDNDESAGTNADDDLTPTGEEGEEGKKKDDEGKDNAEQVRAKQKAAWLADIKSGKRTLQDIPKHLNWLKTDIKKDLDAEKGKKGADKGDDMERAVQKALREERAKEDFDALIEDLQNAELTEEQDAQLREEYEDQLSEFENPTIVQKLKALTTARRLVGLKDNAEALRERRRKGRSLPPFGNKQRKTTQGGDQTTEMEKKLGGNLPKGYKA